LISPEKIEEIKNAHDIVDVISEYLTVKKAGRNFKALCPFHQEKTPSFVVSPDKQIFHCFGCHEGGNVFTFVQKMENFSFVESLNHLAAKAGIAIDYVKTDVKYDDRKKLVAINKDALVFFKDKLSSNEQVLKYAKERGINEKAIEEFQIGFAPGGTSLYSYLTEKGHSEELMMKSWLVAKRERGNVDIFNKRLIFPIFNIYGDPIAFGARVLDNSLPKYINSGETDAYIKGRNLYNLNNARKYREDVIAIVEGYTDAIALYEHGIKNVVATLGTALTVEQAKLIKRYTRKIVIVYDMDDAGKQGAIRAGENLFAEGVEVLVAVYEGAKDPDEFVKKFGADKLKEKIKNAMELLYFKMEQMEKKGDVKNAYYRETILKELVMFIEKTDSVVVKNDSVKKISEKLNIAEDVIKGYMKSKTGESKGVQVVVQERGDMLQRGLDLAEKTLLAVVLNGIKTDDEAFILKHYINKRESVKIEYNEFSNRTYSKILEKIEIYFNAAEKEILQKLEIDFIDDEEINKIISEILAENSEKVREEKNVRRKSKIDFVMEVIDDCFVKMRDETIKDEIVVLQKKINTAEKEERFDDLNKYLKEKKEFQKILKQRGENFG